MPELPEVDAITGVVARHSIGQKIIDVEIVRQPKNNAYFPHYKENMMPNRMTIEAVYRRGKHVLFDIGIGKYFIDCHNAMSGYWDYEDEPWTFDYIEGPRTPGESDVRVRMSLANGKVLRFHDTRMFGSLDITHALPVVGPELMVTPHMMPGAPVIDLKGFRDGLKASSFPIKHLLMLQPFIAGIGNIYANEACHVAGVDPTWPANLVPATHVPILLEALRGVVSHSIPTVTYQWLDVYRRTECGTCRGPILRETVGGRATFSCPRCQHDPE